MVGPTRRPRQAEAVVRSGVQGRRRGRHQGRRRSPVEWAIRGAGAAIVAALGIGAVTGSIAASVRGRDPALAHRLAPSDGRWTALLASSLSLSEASPAQRRRADALARLALRQNPAAVQAVSALGINAQIRGDTPGARRLFRYAERLSRRDQPTHLWAIEDAVVRNDIPDALRHYDMALRTSRTSSKLLFPTLASAIEDATVRRALLRRLGSKPGWTAEFTDYVAINGAPRPTAQLLRAMQQSGLSVPEQSRATLLGRLLVANDIAGAWNYYQSLRPGVDRRVSRDPTFSDTVGVPTAFDWVPLTDGGVVTTLQRGDDKRPGTFQFSAPSSVGGPVLQQMQFLPPGTYRLEGRASEIEQPADSLPYWQLTCIGGRELGHVVVPASANNGGVFRGEYQVPADCPTQLLMLIARPSDAVGGISGQIDQVRLKPR